jgi:hypothetical protein
MGQQLLEVLGRLPFAAAPPDARTSPSPPPGDVGLATATRAKLTFTGRARPARRGGSILRREGFTSPRPWSLRGHPFAFAQPAGISQ